MPRLDSYGDRERIERLLSDTEIAVLRMLCAAAGVDVDDWTRSPQLAPPWALLATMRLAERRNGTQRLGRQRAVRQAAAALGIDPETLATWRKRWPAAVRERKVQVDPGSQ